MQKRNPPHLKRALIQAANGAVKKKKTFYHSKYNRLRFKKKITKEIYIPGKIGNLVLKPTK